MKKGFTLAEVLVTLGIIGVVAALTTPALIQNVGSQKVGPKLSKAVATFETASEMMLTDQDANTLLAISGNGGTLMGNTGLSKYMKISGRGNCGTYKNYAGADLSLADYSRFDSEDGMTYCILTTLQKRTPADGFAPIPSNQRIGSIYVDINGSQNPNKVARDLFRFHLYNDGTLRPYGGTNANRAVNANLPAAEQDGAAWNVNEACDSNGVHNGDACTGSIFENGMKIVYD